VPHRCRRTQIGLAAAVGPVILAGDARVGVLPAPSILGATVGPRGCTDATVNTHGRLLTQLCTDTGLVLCTGHAPEDEAVLPTWHRGRLATCVDHLLVSPAAYPAVSSSTVGALRPDSDHCPLHLQLKLFMQPAPAPPPSTGGAFHQFTWQGRCAQNMPPG